MEEREDGGVRPDADGQREDRGQAEDRVAAQPAQAVAKVGEQRLQPYEDVAVAGVLSLERVAAEPAPRFAPRRLGRSPGRDELVGALGQVEVHLPVDLVRDCVGAKDVTEARKP